jgi:Acetyltransferase (GNAT) domain
MGEPIRSPVDPAEIQAELTPATLLREFRGINIHAVTADSAPSVMQEVGRIREVEFRAEGGGTGRSVDIDQYDVGPHPFLQLVAWDSQHREIIGMYRLADLASRLNADGTVDSPTARLFSFSPEFRSHYMPYAVELGRSVVNRTARKALMGLFCVWAGLGAVVRERPDIRYFFGKVTVYPGYDPGARGAIYHYLNEVCPDPYGLVAPLPEFLVPVTTGEPAVSFHEAPEGSFQRLSDTVRGFGAAVPPLLISYLELSRTMMSFGTACNPHFGDVYETAILVTIADINEKQRKRFIDSYVPGSQTPDTWAAARL